MLKHATINRTSRAQQTLQLQRQWQQQKHQSPTANQEQPLPQQLLPLDALNILDGCSSLDVTDSANQSLTYYHSPSPQPPSIFSCNSPTPSSSILSSPSKLHNNNNNSNNNNWITTATTSNSPSPSLIQSSVQTSNSRSKCSSESMIKVFAQSLSQDLEYVTLHVDTQTKSQQIIKSLLRKFRLKHRDPNLFYLTLERWIRKDGLKFKSVMLLGDEASPLQLQQCCSNPPHNDIKFTLQMRAGSLVKIYCSDVVPNARYKCLSLSAQTTVEETIELMLHCLNLATPTTAATTTTTTNTNHHHLRSSGSPSSTSSSASSSCSTSSGIESDSNHHNLHQQNGNTFIDNANDHLDSESRTSSVTSISSTSNVSSISTSITDQYCLIIECIEKSYERIIESDEYLVDVYQNLLNDTKGHNSQLSTPPPSAQPSSLLTLIGQNVASNSNIINSSPSSSSEHQPDQWFLIKLKRRNDCRVQEQVIKFMNPRQNVPLPPIPVTTLGHQFNGDTESITSIVSTTQIEVKCRPVSSMNHLHATSFSSTFDNSTKYLQQAELQQNSSTSRMPPPPEIIFLPPIRPRRRNLSNASSTFCRPLVNNNNNNTLNNRRRYDPAQLADDLNKLDVTKEAEISLSLTDKMSTTDSHNPDSNHNHLQHDHLCNELPINHHHQADSSTITTTTNSS